MQADSMQIPSRFQVENVDCKQIPRVDSRGKFWYQADSKQIPDTLQVETQIAGMLQFGTNLEKLAVFRTPVRR